MITLKFHHPLQWPVHYPVTAKWERTINSSFKQGLTPLEALTFLHEELDALKVQQAILLTDYEHIENPRLMRKVGQENGAVIQFKLHDKTYRVACDHWVSLEQNLYALHLALRNLRHILDWGVGDVGMLLGGFSETFFAQQTVRQASAEKPLIERRKSSRSELEGWRLALGLGPTATLEDAHAVYRRRAKLVANQQDELLKLNLAMDEATKQLGG